MDDGKNPDSAGFVTAAERELLARTFHAADANGTGALSEFELRDLWLAVFPSVSEAEAERIACQVFSDISPAEGEVQLAVLLEYLGGSAEDAQTVAARPQTVRQWIWAVMDDPETYPSLPWLSYINFAWSFVTQSAIVLSIANMMVETWPSFQQTPADRSECTEWGGACTISQVRSGNSTTWTIEVVCIAVFTLEFSLRTLSTPSQKTFWRGAYTWVDLLAILPFYLTEVGLLQEGSGAESLLVLRVLRLLKLVRVLRVLKLGRHSQGIQLMVVAMARSRMALGWLCVMLCMATALFASLIYYVERESAVFDAQQQKWFRPETSKYTDRGKEIFFQHIPDAMWWTLVTLTTVGYGDSYPVTEMGKVVASATMLCGLLVVAYPVTILCSVFQQAYDEFNEEKERKNRQRLLQKRIKESRRQAQERQKGTAHTPSEKALGAAVAPAPLATNPLCPTDKNPAQLNQSQRPLGGSPPAANVDPLRGPRIASVHSLNRSATGTRAIPSIDAELLTDTLKTQDARIRALCDRVRALTVALDALCSSSSTVGSPVPSAVPPSTAPELSTPALPSDSLATGDNG
eukprot:TRINITY_DN5484_c0_g1_i1.p1 TRINITY_DN5484_c0_g1~~TRINITY_DN5484_c0_g1_i1.p1  ORF type:complete len:576 (+),score=171.49 TRINITY_DN5484_c0_g1_i1:145-1872(+)